MKIGWLLAATVIVTTGCNDKSKDKEEEEKTEYFPALSFIQSQVKHIDTSVYPILKVVKTDARVDSVYINRKDFKREAQDFLNLPDLTTKKWKDKYTETKRYDETLNRVIFTYTPTDPEAEIRRQEVIIQPDAQSGDKVTTIFIDRLLDSRDSTVQKRLTWQVNKRFQIASIVQKEGQPDRVQTTEVIWNDFAPEQ